MAYPRFRRARTHKFARRTAGDVAFTSTTFAAVDTALDFTLEAQVGDVIEFSGNGMWSNENIASALDVATWVSGAAVNYFSSGTGTSAGNGLVGWYGVQAVYAPFSGAVHYVVQAGDIVSGLVTVRLLGRTTTAGTRTLFASGTNLLQVAAKNLGPVDPN